MLCNLWSAGVEQQAESNSDRPYSIEVGRGCAAPSSIHRRNIGCVLLPHSINMSRKFPLSVMQSHLR
jgi:hypothetical protein